MSFLDLQNKTIVVFGVANKKSVAYHTASILRESGATVIYSVRSEQRMHFVQALHPDADVHVCDVGEGSQIESLAQSIRTRHPKIDGILHSIAFANYEDFSGHFHDVEKRDFLHAVDVSCYSLIRIAKAFKTCLAENASVVTISISTTRMAAESYGYMAPVKAALDSSVVFLAKSFSRFSRVRFNAVCAGLLKTSASAGIPNYMDNYLYAEQATLRKEALKTSEVANAAAFLLSPRSSGMNAQGLVVDCGMGVNYFDHDIVKHTSQGLWPTV